MMITELKNLLLLEEILWNGNFKEYNKVQYSIFIKIFVSSIKSPLFFQTFILDSDEI